MANLDLEHPLDVQLTIAAALHLLSSASLRGTTIGKCEALAAHLQRLSQDPALSQTLRQCCAELHQTWQQVSAVLSQPCTCDEHPRLVH